MPTTAPEQQALDAMVAELARAPEVHRPSRFWAEYAQLHARQLADHGFAHFKRTVNQHYFNWMARWPLPDDQFRRVAGAWLRRPDPRVLRARLDDDAVDVQVTLERIRPFRQASHRQAYAVYVAMLWEFARERDRLGLLQGLEEPALGDPLLVHHRGRAVTQDLANSVLELNSIVEATGMADLSRRTLLEIGAGYGRLSWLTVHAFPGAQVIICDIPPALAISQWYLTTLFPERPAFLFRPFEDAEEVAEELMHAQLAFLLPHQLELLPSLGADLAVNISSLGEMRPEQIARWFELLDRHTTGAFFSKQWKTSYNPHDGVTITLDDYPVPAGWERVWLRDAPVQRRFFEAAYRIGASA